MSEKEYPPEGVFGKDAEYIKDLEALADHRLEEVLELIAELDKYKKALRDAEGKRPDCFGCVNMLELQAECLRYKKALKEQSDE